MSARRPASVETAIILAAGAGRRLGELTAQKPKMFLEIHGRKMVDYQLAYLEARGISTVIMATGHMHALVVDTLGQNHFGIRMKYAENESYLAAGSAWSLLCCRDTWREAPGDVLFLHSDIFYDPGILDLVLASEYPTVFALDDGYKTMTGDEVVMTGRRNVIEGIHKGPSSVASEFIGEVVGIHRFSRQYLAEFFDFLTAVLTPSDRSHHYEFLSVELARKRNRRMNYVSINRLPWVNVNHGADLQYAIDTVYPAIAK